MNPWRRLERIKYWASENRLVSRVPKFQELGPRTRGPYRQTEASHRARFGWEPSPDRSYPKRLRIFWTLNQWTFCCSKILQTSIIMLWAEIIMRWKWWSTETTGPYFEWTSCPVTAIAHGVAASISVWYSHLKMAPFSAIYTAAKHSRSRTFHKSAHSSIVLPTYIFTPQRPDKIFSLLATCCSASL